VNQFQPIFDKQKDYFNTDAAILEVKKRPKPLSGFLFSRD
jgi:hypothetical protein